MSDSGPSLLQWLNEQGHLTIHQLKQLGLNITKTLNLMHLKGWIHMDLKLENILIDTKGFGIKLVNFGLSRKKSGDSLKKARSPFSASTPVYSAPELLQHTPRATPAADIYALGVILWECFYGRDRNEYGALFSHDPDAFKDAVRQGYRLKIVGSCPGFLKELIERCWKAEPSERPDAKTLYEMINTWEEKPSPPEIPSVVLQAPVVLSEMNFEPALAAYPDPEYPDSEDESMSPSGSCKKRQKSE